MDYYQKKCIILILNESWCVLLPGTRPVRPPSGGSKFIYLFFFYGNSFGIVPEPRSILKKEKLSITKEELQLN